MSVLIRGDVIEADPYQPLADDEKATFGGYFIVSYERWSKDYPMLGVSGAALGVRIPNTVDLTRQWPVLCRVPLIVLEFPSFADGRAYSQARFLAERCGFEGELRATGAAVTRDQIPFMARCGFNSFELRADQDPEACLKAIHEIDLAYQRAADGIQPVLERRRARA